jgi:hypothetical protein
MGGGDLCHKMEIRNEMIKPSAGRSEYPDYPRIHSQCMPKGQFHIGFILFRRKGKDFRLHRQFPKGPQGIEIADCQIGADAEME